jgi:hypothetical protein
VAAADLVEVLVTHDPPGAGIGGHRDAPMFGTVIGVSLSSSCRFRFQRRTRPERHVAAVMLEPRSAYALAGGARWQWQQSIPPAKTERFSVSTARCEEALAASRSRVHWPGSLGAPCRRPRSGPQGGIVATARKSATKRRGTRTGRTRARPQPQPVPPPADPVVEVTASEPPVPLSVPEPALAGRVVPPADRPLPAYRRAIFFDVENTSRAEHISRVLAHLAVDRAGRRTEFFAVGNWRVIGHDTARLLARHGAQLVHSAPSVGVRDWSDLRIAVASGVWLASARADDVIEIVSDDRAFDAVGDVAASLGVAFHRLSYRGLLGMPVVDVPEREAPAESSHSRHGGGGSRRGRRGRRHGRPEHAPPRPMAHPPVAAAPSAVAGGEEPHTAPHDEIVAVVRELAHASAGRNVTLDTLANALKARGFSRPPGSPRLITRLRRIKELEVSRSGVITLHDGTAPPPPVVEPEAVAEPADSGDAVEERQPEVATEEPEAIEPGNDRRAVYEPRRDDGGQGRRRSRRGGRRRRGGRGGGGGGGGGRPPMGDQRQPTPREVPPRDAAAREAAVREAFRTRTAPSYITGEPLA